MNEEGRVALEKDVGIAIRKANFALVESRKLSYLQGIGDAYMTLGAAAKLKGDLQQSILYYDTAIQIRSLINDPVKLANSYSGVASVYVDFASFNSDSFGYYNNRAMDYYRAARAIYLKNNATEDLAKNDINIGHLLGYLNNLPEAIKYFKLGYLRGKIISDSNEVSRAARNIAGAYINLELYDSAKFWLDSTASNLCASCDEIRIGANQIKGLMFFKIYEDDSAKTYYDVGMNLLKSKNFPFLLRDQYTYYLDYFLELKEVDSASKYYYLLTELNDSLFNSEKRKGFQLSAEQFHSLQKEKEANQAMRLTYVAKRNLTLTIICAFVIALTSFFLIRNSRQKRRIAEQQSELSNQKIDNLLQSQEMKRIDAMLEGQEQERKRIAADLHDRLGSILGAVKLHFNTVEEQIDIIKQENKSQYERAKALLDEATDEVRKIAHNMVSGTLMKFGLLSAVLDLKADLEQSGSIKIKVFHSGMNERLPAELEIEIYRIIQELISNVLKHASAQTIEIGLNQLEDEFNITFEDDGKGFNRESVSEGLGFQNLKQRTSKLNGILDIHSVPGKGTQVTVSVPLI